MLYSNRYNHVQQPDMGTTHTYGSFMGTATLNATMSKNTLMIIHIATIFFFIIINRNMLLVILTYHDHSTDDSVRTSKVCQIIRESHANFTVLIFLDVSEVTDMSAENRHIGNHTMSEYN